MTTKDRIYRKELDKALAAGMREGKAIIHASEETERMMYIIPQIFICEPAALEPRCS